MKIKKLMLLSLLCLPLMACNNEDKPSYIKGEDIRVTFHLNGGSLLVNNQSVQNDISIKVNDEYFYNHRYLPEKDNMLFTTWYLDEELTLPLDYSSFEVSGDLDLYARWTDDYFIYELNEDGNALIGLNKTGTTISELSIPSYLDCHKVTGIMDYGFAHSISNKLYVPYFIETIGYSSFYESSIEYIKLGKNITNIEYGAFIGTNNIKELKIENNDKYMVHNMTLFEKLGNNRCEMHSLFDADDLDITLDYYSENISIVSIAPYCFYGRKNVHSMQLPIEITYIGDYAFAESGLIKFYMNNVLEEIGDYAFANSYLNEAYLYNPLKKIGDYAFQNTMITRINIPNTLLSIGRGALQAGVLSEVTIGSNEKYVYEDGNILEKLNDNEYALVHFNPQGKGTSYRLSRNIIKIYSGAFYSLEALESIYFTNVKEVEDYLFLSLEKYHTIYFEGEPTKISDKAFYEETRNMCFHFTATVKDGSLWSIYFSELQEYVVLVIEEQ